MARDVEHAVPEAVRGTDRGRLLLEELVELVQGAAADQREDVRRRLELVHGSRNYRKVHVRYIEGNTFL